MRFIIETQSGTFRRMIAHHPLREIRAQFLNSALGEILHVVSPDETFDEAVSRIEEDYLAVNDTNRAKPKGKDVG